MNVNLIMIITMAVYLLGMIVIGIYFSRKNKDTSDFYLGGRTLGPLVTAFSAEASDMSSYLLMGVPGLAYIAGMAEASWTAIGLAVGTYLNWLLVAKRMRRYTVATNSITVPEFFSKRFGDKKNILNLIAALVIIIFFVPYTASGFAACGKLFSTLFGSNYVLTMIISAVIIILYTTIGGFLAASTTDLIQGVIMTFALLVVFGFGIASAGGVGAVIDNAKSLPGYLNVFQGYVADTNSAGTFGFIPVVSTLAWGLGYFGMPHILLRFMAIKEEKKLKTSRRIASVWVVLSLFIATFIGVIGLAMKDISLDASTSETVIIEIARLIANHGWFFAIIGGLILAGILAATMSTADSQLLAASSSVSENLFGQVFGIKLSKKASMLIARLTVIIIAVIAVFIALDKNSSVFRVVSFAWAGFGAAFGPIVLIALFWKRANKYGAIAGMISGAAMVFIWKFLIRSLGGAWDIYELLPAFIVNVIITIVVSLITPAPEKEITDTFEAVIGKKAE